jgi:uncharacterized protein|tara:strand:- start:75964 stop:76152 length:189 start_codon:yes stop_codon:yes gene_type:complete
MAWQDLFSALALVLIIEGIMPFISPEALRNTYKRITEMDDRTVRASGLVSMMIGVLLLTFVR